MEKLKIQVRQDGKTIKTIKRKVWAEQIGNFNPIFCRYNKNNRVLVQSDEGDLSDSFRREDSYKNSLYIEIKGK